MTKFLTAIESGIQASLSKENNIKEILEMVEQVKHEVESFSKGKVTLELTYPLTANLALMKIFGVSQNLEKSSETGKPTDRVLTAILTNNSSISEKLTIIEFGTQGYPCTITVDGNQLTAADNVGLEKMFVKLLGSPITGNKLRKLVGLYTSNEN